MSYNVIAKQIQSYTRKSQKHVSGNCSISKFLIIIKTLKKIYNGQSARSLLDYVICNTSVMKHFSKFYVGLPNILSDHCTVNFSFEGINNVNNLSAEESTYADKVSFKYKWNKSKLNIYKESLQSETFVESINRLVKELENNDTSSGIDSSLNSFSLVMHTVCSPLFGRNVLKRKKQTNKNAWYDVECITARNDFYVCQNRFKYNESD